MSTKKKDLEIVYNLRWRNGSKKDDKKQMSIVAVYDIPSTTLNFEVFKSYLLKNSGTPEDDVNVFYIMDNGKEYLITTQIDFQVALYAFRRKARANEVIQLLLERISDKKPRKVAKSADVETQFDTEEHQSVVSTTSTCRNIEAPPEWFLDCMLQLKRDIKNDVYAHVSVMVNQAVTELKQYVSSCMSRRPRMNRKCKSLENEEKIIRKSSKLEHKLEHKLEKLELKASKYREKRLALLQSQKTSDNGPKSSDSDAGPSAGRSCSREHKHERERGKPKDKNLEELKRVIELKAQQIKDDVFDAEEDKTLNMMNARPVNTQRSLPHLLGGEIYMHQWEVENNGSRPWTSATKLEYTWGSKKLVPTDKIIAVPNLNPGERGSIYVRLQVPNEPGSYECYWHFTHNDRRFGQWLGVKLIVDPFDLKGNSSVLETTALLGAMAPTAVDDGLDTTKTEGETGRSYMEHCLNDYEKFRDEMNKKAIGKAATSEPIIKDVEKATRSPSLTFSPLSWSSDMSSLQGHCSSKDELEEYLLMPSKEALSRLEVKSMADAAEKEADSRNSVSDKSVNEYIIVSSTQSLIIDTDCENDYESLPKTDELIKPSTSEVPTQSAVAENFDDNNNAEKKAKSSSGCIRFRDEDLDNMVVITVPKDDDDKEDFMCVHVDGQKVLIPKTILKSEVVTAAQISDGVVFGSSEIVNKPTSSRASTATLHDTPRQSYTPKPEENAEYTLDSGPPKNLEEPLVPQTLPHQHFNAVDLSTGSKEESAPHQHYIAVDLSTGGKEEPHMVDEGVDRSTYYDPSNYMSHCSAAGSCYSEVNCPEHSNGRLFVFPQNIPGYEVVPHLHQAPGSVYVEAPNPAVYNIPAPVMPNPFGEPAPISHLHRVDPITYLSQPWHDPGVHVHGCPKQGRYEEPQLPPTAPSQEPQQQGTGSSQPPGRWVNGHWVSTNPETPREANLQALAEMGFWNRDLNATLLARFNDDLNRVVAELVR